MDKPILKYFDIHLVEHCNLNCKGCDHFSPLAQPEYSDPSKVDKDFRRLSNLLNVERFSLMGGEPLLHPFVDDFMQIARKNFPKSIIQLVTYGILLPRMIGSFWMRCKQFDIEIVCTKYPINLDFEKIEFIAKSKGVKFNYFGDTGTNIRKSNKIPLNLKGEEKNTYPICYHAVTCCSLSKGRIYPCTVAPNARHFNNYFNEKLELSEKDSINIYEAKTGQEIIDFIKKPIPFCRYCDIKNRSFNHGWEKSKREKLEWVA